MLNNAASKPPLIVKVRVCPFNGLPGTLLGSFAVTVVTAVLFSGAVVARSAPPLEVMVGARFKNSVMLCEPSANCKTSKLRIVSVPSVSNITPPTGAGGLVCATVKLSSAFSEIVYSAKLPLYTAVSTSVAAVVACKISRTILRSPGLRVRFSISEVSDAPPNAGLLKLGVPSAKVLNTLPAFGPLIKVLVFIDSAE